MPCKAMALKNKSYVPESVPEDPLRVSRQFNIHFMAFRMIWQQKKKNLKLVQVPMLVEEQ